MPTSRSPRCSPHLAPIYHNNPLQRPTSSAHPPGFTPTIVANHAAHLSPKAEPLPMDDEDLYNIPVYTAHNSTASSELNPLPTRYNLVGHEPAPRDPDNTPIGQRLIAQAPAHVIRLTSPLTHRCSRPHPGYLDNIHEQNRKVMAMLGVRCVYHPFFGRCRESCKEMGSVLEEEEWVAGFQPFAVQDSPLPTGLGWDREKEPMPDKLLVELEMMRRQLKGEEDEGVVMGGAKVGKENSAVVEVRGAAGAEVAMVDEEL